MKWFGEDGRLLALPDPVKEISSRPPIIDDEGPALTTPYRHVRLYIDILLVLLCSLNHIC